MGTKWNIFTNNIDLVNEVSSTVIGPAVATDNAVARFDGTTGKLIQNSGTTLSDADLLSTGELNLTTDLAVSHGGTGASSFNTGSVLIGGSTITDTGTLAKGEIIVGDGVGAPQRLSVGTNNQILSVDDAEEAGLKWIEEGANMQKSAFGEMLTANLIPAVLVHFPYNLNTDIVNTTTAGSGTVTHSEQFAIISTGAATSSSAQLLTNRFLEYQPGQGGLIRFTAIFTDGVIGSSQIIGAGNATDGFFVGYNADSFGVMRRSDSVDTWVPQPTWNIDPMDGTGPSGQVLDTNKGNVFQIRYQWLGFGAITFSIEDSATGAFQEVHRLAYANLNTSVSVQNPSFPFRIEAENTTNNSDIVIKSPSIGMFNEGFENNKSYTRNAIDNEKTLSAATETNILTIRNKTTYQSVTNSVQIQPDFLTVASDGNKNFTYRIYVNATLGGSPSYADISTNTSVVDYDTAGTTVSGGTLVATIITSKTGQNSVAFNEFGFILSPGSTLTVSAESSQAGDATVGISWQERFS